MTTFALVVTLLWLCAAVGSARVYAMKGTYERHHHGHARRGPGIA